MRIAILSRSANLYSTQSLLLAGQRRGHDMHIVDHLQCDIVVDNEHPNVHTMGIGLSQLDAIIPRIGASVTKEGAAVIRQFENLRVYTMTRSAALLEARDKLHCLQKLQFQNIPVPRTIFLGKETDIERAILMLGGPPVVIKMLESTHGVGVVLAESTKTAISIIEAFQRTKEKVVLQEFIAEANGSDLRAFVVGDEIVASMMRTAAAGEFRSNLHRGATAEIVQLTSTEQQIVKKVVRTMKLDVAGVDILRGKDGPLVMEVNASPGLEGIETTTKVDIAGKIIQHLENRLKSWKSITRYQKK